MTFIKIAASFRDFSKAFFYPPRQHDFGPAQLGNMTPIGIVTIAGGSGEEFEFLAYSWDADFAPDPYPK
jgi:hypothetical protein